MASVNNILTEKTTKNQSNFEVITLSSDEEESVQNHEDVSFLFKRFILACRPHVTKEAIKEARSLFTEVQGKLYGSHELGDMLERYGKQITKDNADLYLNLICNALNEKKSGNINSVSLDLVNVGENRVIDKVAKSVTFCDVSSPRAFEPTTKLSTNQNINKTVLSKDLPDISMISDDDFVSKMPSKKLTERVENMPSTSTAYQDAKPDKANGKISIKTLTKNQKKKLVARLKQRLKEISNEIKILDRAELTLEEMDMCDSTYIKENRLKKKFEKTWTKLCKILGRLPNTGRVVEKPVHASSTGYSMIDKEVDKFLKDNPGSFPDYFDIRDIVLKTNQKHDLRMSPQVLNGIIADIFMDIGNKLQRRREKDLLFNFGSHLLDDFNAEEDPALSSEYLARQLEKNRRISKRNLKQVYSKYTHLERYKIDDKSRKFGSSKVDKDISSESGTSDDEQQSKNHEKYTRLDRHEVRGKSRKRKGSQSTRPGTSRGVDRDVSSESSTSEDEQDLSRTENDDSIVVENDDSIVVENDDSIVVENSDFPSSQEYSIMATMHEPSTDMSLSTSNAEKSLADTDQVEQSLSDIECPASPTFPLSCPINNKDNAKTSEQTTFDPECSNDDTSRHKQALSSSSDCEIINDPNEQEQLDTPDNKPSVSQKQPNTDVDFEIVNNPNGQKQLDEPANKLSVSEIQPNTNDECEIVNDPQEQSVSMRQLDEPANEPSVCEPHLHTDDDCLIIEGDQETIPTTTSCEESSKIATSTPSDELTLTLNALREVFRMRGDTVDKSKPSTSMCNDSTEPGNSDSDGQIVPDRVCPSEVSTSRDNIEDLCKTTNSDLQCSTLVSDDDIVMSDTEQCSTSNNLKESVGIFNLTYCPPSPTKTDQTTPRTSTTSNSSPKHSEAGNNKFSHSSPKPITKGPDNVVNPRKRKATTELAVQIPKSSVKCLEQIAIALKNKRLKLPDAWVNSNKAENDSNSSLSKATPSKESTVSHSTNENPLLLVSGKAKIDLQHRQVFREKTLNALKVPTKPGCNNNNMNASSPDITPSNKTVSNISVPASDIVDKTEQCEVIIIDD